MATGIGPRSLDLMSHEVLIGYEATPQGEDAVALGSLLCEVLGARPMIATILPYSRSAMGREDLEKALELDTAAMFDVLGDRLRSHEPEFRAIASHSPAHGLADLAGEMGAAVIAIGSTHRGPIGRIVFGSTAEGLLQGAPAPVAVAPRGFGENTPRQLLRFGVGYDGSPESVRALETAIDLAERVHGSLTVLSVAEPIRPGYGTPMAMVAGAAVITDGRALAAQVLDEGLERVPPRLPVEGRVLIGPAAQHVAEAAKGFDLLLLGSRGHGPLLRTLLGSVSGPIARNAPRPVLVLPRGASGIPPAPGRSHPRRRPHAVGQGA